MANDELYQHIIDDYLNGRLTAEEAAQEIHDGMRAGHGPFTMTAAPAIKKVFYALARLSGELPPTDGEAAV